MRAAALKAREGLRATINEDYLSGYEELVGRKRAAPKRLGDDVDDEYRPKRSKLAAMGISKRQRCGVCEGCNAVNCGKCIYCRDMPQYGGRGNMRQSCKDRKCHVRARLPMRSPGPAPALAGGGVDAAGGREVGHARALRRSPPCRDRR